MKLLILGGQLPLCSYKTGCNIFKDSPIKQDRLLLNKTDIGAKPFEADLTDGFSVEFDRARSRIVPAFEKADNCAFARATSTLLEGQHIVG